MKKRARIQPFHLPNHSWIPVDWAAEMDPAQLAERKIRECSIGILLWNGPLKWGKDLKHTTFLPPGERVTNESKPFDLWLCADFITGRLEQLAESGDSDSALELARIATAATVALNRIAAKSPKLLLRYSRLRHGWPVIKMKREKLSRAEKELFEAIQLGAEAKIEINPGASKWDANNDYTKIAYLLFLWVDRYNSNAPPTRRLPPFSDANWESWWKIAEKSFRASYPRPQDIPELNALVTGESKRKYPSTIEQEILERLQKSFHGLAKSGPRPKKTPRCECGEPASKHTSTGWVCERCFALEQSYRT